MFDLKKNKRNTEDSSRGKKNSFYIKDMDRGYTSSASKKNKKGFDVQEDWLITYADAMTLLLVFFILLFSFSEIDQAKFEEIHESIQGNLLKREQVSPFTEVREKIEKTIEVNQLEEVISMEEDALGIKLEFASSMLYELGSAEIRPAMQEPLSLIGTSISELQNVNYLVEVEGHTDDIPIRSGVYQSNWELSAHRATNIVRYFNSSGIPQERLRAVAYGESRPKVPNRDEFGEPIVENQAINRRVVVHVRRARSRD